MAKLTKRFIDQIKPDVNKDIVLWDDDVKGFGLRVKPSGKKSFIIQYRNAHGRSRRLTIGTYGIMMPTGARKDARERLVAVQRGEDPAQQESDMRKGLSMAQLAERYLVEHAEVKKKASSVKKDRERLRNYILPAIGKRRIDEITRNDIAKLHHDMRAVPYQANRVLENLRKMFNLAEVWGLRTDGTNPCRHIQRYKEEKRQRFLTGDELYSLGEALEKAKSTEMPSAILAIKLLMFTGCRLGEILTLKWSEVDLERSVLNLTDSKTGAKPVVLPEPAIDLLLKAHRMNNNPYVCPGLTEGGHLVGIQRIWERIRAKAGLENLRLHDLRHSFASVAAAANMGLPIIGKLLGHTQAQTTQRYAHLAFDPLQAASEEIAKRIDEAMKRKPESRKVIPFKK